MVVVLTHRPAQQSSTDARLRARLMSGSLWSSTFQLVSKGSLFLVSAVLARHVSVASFGAFIAAQGAVILAAAILDRGVSLSTERESAMELVGRELAGRLLRIRVFEAVGLACFAMAVTFALGIGPSGPAKLLVAATIGPIYLSTFSTALLNARQLFRTTALSLSFGRLGYLLLMVILTLTGEGLLAAALAWIISELMIAVLQYFLVLRSLGSSHSSTSTIRDVLSVYRRATPYWIAVVAYLAYNRADSLIALWLAGAGQAGLYAPASNIQNAAMVVPAALTATLAVVGSAAVKAGLVGTRQLTAEVRVLAMRALAVSIGASALISVFAPILIDVFAGHAFAGSVTPTRILIWSLPFNALQGACVGLLVALGAPRKTTLFYVTCFVVSLAANIILTPAYGAVGAACAALVREPLGLLVLLLMLRSELHSSASGTEMAFPD